jgi:protein SCO1/2
MVLMMFSLGIKGSFAIDKPAGLEGVGIVEKLGTSIPLNTFRFKDESNQDVEFAKFFSRGRPVLLNFVYYECTSLCTFVLNGVVDSLKRVDLVPGRDFELVTVSIDPKDTAELATKKKKNYLKAYGRAEAAAGWHFLISPTDAAQKLADAVGFQYKYIEAEKQFSHPAATFVLTPEGKLSRVLYGIEYQPRDLKLALAEASTSKISNVVERFLLYCYRYDPNSRKYTFYATRLVQAGSLLMILCLGGYMWFFWRKERKRSI